MCDNLKAPTLGGRGYHENGQKRTSGEGKKINEIDCM